MSCENNVCGTGDWGGPQPGDPDNNISLSARNVYGGLLVAWSYPLINGNAVAYTDVYRGTSSDAATAVLLEHAGGSSYFDRLSPQTNTDYYYWIEVVSIHGTRGARIGPALGTARPIGVQTLESLTGLIDAGQLAIDLKTRIDGLTLTNDALYKEINDRLMANTAFSTAMADIQSGLTQAMTVISNEVTSRKDGDSALVQQVNLIAAANKTAMAAIDDEKTVRVSKDDALAQRIDSMLVTVGSNTTAIQSETTARVNADSALGQRIDTVATTAGNAASAVRDETTARVNANSALSQRITTTESAINGNTASGQVGLITQVSNVNGTVNRISAEYFAKVQVNGLIGGFGIYNNGATVEAGFDVDRFWLGRTSDGAKVKPFILDNGVVYIDRARIRDADIDTLKIAGNSVMVGVYATGGSTEVSSGGSVTLINRTVDLGDASNSGLMVMGTIYYTGHSNDALGFRTYINEQLAGDQRTGMRDGFGSLAPASGFLTPGTRYATVRLEAYVPGPGSASIVNSSIAIMGGKR